MAKVTKEQILSLLGPFPEPFPVKATILESKDCGNYVQEKMKLQVEEDDFSYAYLLIPKGTSTSLPAIYCHHQHTGDRIGKAELVGLEGNPELAYAKELAERGYITFAPDAFTFGERRHAENPTGYTYWVLATGLVQGKTFLAKLLHDLFAGLDYLVSRPEVDNENIGFIGHSYGGRMATWAAAMDHRIKTAVSNCGTIAYKHSLGPEAGVQMEFVIPNAMAHFDIEDLLALIEPNHFLISATEEDKWCLGVEEVYKTAKSTFEKGTLQLNLYPGGHVFTVEMREAAYQFLDKFLKA